MKKLFSILLLAAFMASMSVGLVGCGGATTKAKSTEAETTKAK